MVPRKLQVLKTFHSNSQSWNGICDEPRSLAFGSFLKSRMFELFALEFLSKVSASWHVSDLPFTAGLMISSTELPHNNHIYRRKVAVKII